MKRTILMVAVAMLGMLATSCNKEELLELTTTHVTLNATYEGSGAKVAYSELGSAVNAVWQADDTILLCYNGTANKLWLTAGAGSASATFEGDIAGTPDEGAVMVCFVKDCNATDGAVTVSGDGSYLYSSSAFLGQDGTLASAAKLNLYRGWARYSGGSDIQCSFAVNTALLKFTIRAPDDAVVGDQGTLHYESGGTELARATFTIGQGKSNTLWLSVPAGNYSGTQYLVYEYSNGSGGSAVVSQLSPTHANFVAGQVYSKGLVLGGTVNLDENYGDLTLTDGQVLTGTGDEGTHVTIANGATVTLHDVDITKINTPPNCPGITCQGDATIILSGTNKLKGYGNYSSGLFVPENKTLTIRGCGSLTATGGSNAPGIGGGNSNPCGNIVIEDGTVTAIGNGNNSPGIGSQYNSSCGDITISGGTVTATGKSAGIGGGGGSSSCGNILISSGKVIAKVEGNNLSYGVGIGNNYGTCGTITITGGDVTATGNRGGIGAGGSSSSNCGNILISGGKVTAKAEGTSNVDGCGIGGKCGTITITGGTVTATAGGSGTAGIGSKQNTPCSNITISGGTVVATGDYNAPGIGSGISGGICGNILINGGTVTATGGVDSPGIGSGCAGSECGAITITDDVIHVTATKGTLESYDFDYSIGAGPGGSTCGTITKPTDPSKLTEN